MLVHNYLVPYPSRRVDPIASELRRLWHMHAKASPTVEAKSDNRQQFSGVLTLLDTPSPRPPEGSQGRPIVIPTSVARRTMAQLVGMPINFTQAMNGHNRDSIVGAIDSVEVRGNQLWVHGRLFDRNTPGLAAMIAANAPTLGMSFEIGDVRVEDERASVWRILDCVWTGAAVLAKKAAAFPGTHIQVAAMVGR